jgi:hypothetical protein
VAGDIRLPCLFQHEAQHVLNLGSPSTFDVTQHGGGISRIALGEGLLPPAHERIARPVPIGGGDGSRDSQLVEKDIAPIRRSDYLTDAGAHEARHGGGRGEMDQFLPHALPNICNGQRLYTLRPGV